MDERLNQARAFIIDYVAMLEVLDRKSTLARDDPSRLKAMEALEEARKWLRVQDSATPGTP